MTVLLLVRVFLLSPMASFICSQPSWRSARSSTARERCEPCPLSSRRLLRLPRRSGHNACIAGPRQTQQVFEQSPCCIGSRRPVRMRKKRRQSRMMKKMRTSRSVWWMVWKAYWRCVRAYALYMQVCRLLTGPKLSRRYGLKPNGCLAVVL